VVLVINSTIGGGGGGVDYKNLCVVPWNRRSL